MNNNNCWRVPIPTDINNIQEFTALERAVFRELLSLCQNKDTILHFIHNSRHYQVELKRGQCIFRVSAFAKDLNLNRQKVRGSLSIISKWYSQLNIQGMPYGLVITVKDYDNIINMNNQENNQVTIKQQSSNNQGTPNKSVKSVKSVKSDKSTKKQTPKLSYLEQLKDERFIDLLKKEFPEIDLKNELRAMVDWIKANGNENKYKDFQAFARNWLRRTAKEQAVKAERRMV